ncbi:hypothetical protein ACIRNI_24935 [Streptomyces sp. NPDC093546]|uniref:hypothetical protein n=1 Tax=Streptomyces sp. NPDC093546 TaxID=3366040 RepID=UPI00381577D5
MAGTSKVPLNAEQQTLAKQLGLIPLPASEYLPPTPPKVRGGHAEQNILHFLARRHVANGKESWLPTHGAASRKACPDICPPVTRASGKVVTVYETNSSDYVKFYWPDNYLRKK